MPPLSRRLGQARRAFGQDHLAARLFDRGDRRLRRAGNFDRDRGLEFTLGEQAHAIAGPAQHPGRDERLAVDRSVGGEPFGVKRLLQPAEVDDLEVFLEDLVVKPSFWQTTMQRRLPALEGIDGDAGATELTLAAMARGLALAGANAAPETLRPIMRAWIVFDLVKLHHACPTLIVTPAKAGVQGNRLCPWTSGFPPSRE